ncbi:MAG: hypothetical protein A4E46_01099 [Methanosaeta sp. PtaU1.Bin016]|nr:MAG: hypothetical protein A4E46_01099 [Methanosaeta sp. PtaU1.Bin016]
MSMRFSTPSVQSMMATGLLSYPMFARSERRMHTMPKIALTAGPAKAICSSRRGFLGISSIADTPPKK